jgi:aldose 1-epimerase
LDAKDAKVKGSDAKDSGPASTAARRCAAAEGWELTGPDGLQVEVLALGATWVSCRMPLDEGSRELLLGFTGEADYLRQQSYIGATIGRYANRIAGGRIRWHGRALQLEREPGAAHHLHGGPEGFNRRRWRLIEHHADTLRLALHSPAGDQGYPGTLDCEVSYRMLAGLGVELRFQAQVTEPCPVGLTNHAYFNLDGTGDARSQQLCIAGDHYLPVDDDGIPCAALSCVAASAFDFRAERPIAQHAGQVYDHAFLLDAQCASLQRPAAHLRSADGRVQLALSTTLPALHLYTGQHLAQGTRSCASGWPDCSGIALEPQFLPDSPNHPQWPQPGCWLLPGQRYDHRIVYRLRALV